MTVKPTLFDAHFHIIDPRFPLQENDGYLPEPFKQGLAPLLDLAEHGVFVKTTGFGRVDFDVAAALRDFSAANPECLLFGTDQPSTRSLS